MLTFLPEQQKKEVRREYYIRFFAIVLCMVSIISISTSVLLYPSLYFVTSQKTILSNYLDGRGTPIEKTDTTQLKQKAAALRDSVNRITPPSYITFTDTLSHILALRSDVTIRSISMARTDRGDTTVSFSGVAPSRESLKSYVDTIRSLNGFEKVSLPVSNLVRDKNIPFTFSNGN